MPTELTDARVRESAATQTKTPEPTAGFWVAKLLTTACGEAASDFLARTLGPVPAVGIGAVLFAAMMIWQLAVRRYVVPVYWGAVLMVAVFGEGGKHARSAVGVPVLPLGAAVEVDAVIAVRAG